MASRPRKSDDEAESGDGQAAAPPKSKKKLLLVAAAAGVILLGGGAGAYVMLAGGNEGEDAAAERPAAAPPVAFVEVREMTVNLSPEPNEDRPRFIRFAVRLEVPGADTAARIQPLMPRIEDAFQTYVRELRPSDLYGSAGVYRLREELLRRVNIAVHPARVDAVLFRDVVVQ